MALKPTYYVYNTKPGLLLVEVMEPYSLYLKKGGSVYFGPT